MPNLGKALTVLIADLREQDYIGEDLEAFNAPGECYPIAYRGVARRTRMARRRACHIAGVKNLRLLRRAMRRAMGNDAWVYRHYGHVPY